MSDNKSVSIELDDLETPVVSLHPAFGGARVGGALRVRTEIRAGTLAARGNIVQCYPVAPVGGASVNPIVIVGGG